MVLSRQERRQGRVGGADGCLAAGAVVDPETPGAVALSCAIVYCAASPGEPHGGSRLHEVTEGPARPALRAAARSQPTGPRAAACRTSRASSRRVLSPPVQRLSRGCTAPRPAAARASPAPGSPCRPTPRTSAAPASLRRRPPPGRGRSRSHRARPRCSGGPPWPCYPDGAAVRGRPARGAVSGHRGIAMRPWAKSGSVSRYAAVLSRP